LGVNPKLKKYHYRINMNAKQKDNSIYDEPDYSEEVKEEDIEAKTNPYKVKVFKTNKEIEQPRCCKVGILPSLPTGMILVGRSGSGKTNLCQHILTSPYLFGNTFDAIYLYTKIKPDPELVKTLGIPKDCIKEDYTENDVKEIFDKSMAAVEKQGFKNCPKILMLFDDFVNDRKTMKSKTMSKLAIGNRHAGLSYMLLTQYYKKLTPVFRTNATYIAVFPSSLAELEKLAEEQCPANMSKKEFIKVLQYGTRDKYSFVGIHTKAENKKKLRRGFNEILSSEYI
jgi:hypothetical protein